MMLKLVALAALAALASANWAIKDKGIATIDAGICFVSETTGYTAGDDNGSGPEIFKTTDGADTWQPLNVSWGIDLLPLGCAAAGDSAIVTTIFGEVYTADAGKTWKHSLGGGLSQSAAAFKNDKTGKKFGVAGTFVGGTDGVAVSFNSGAILKGYNAGLFTEARYAAFPSDTTWYVAAGQWPDQNNTAEPKRWRSQFLTPEGRVPKSYTAPTVDTDGYMAQLAMTTDGGSTWSTVFAENGTFYFNGIDCSSPTHCCAVGEASNDSPGAGARIYCTEDGKNWNRTFYSPYTTKEGFSLMQINFVSENEAWAAGGELTSLAPSAWFLHTTDGGKTWTAPQAPLFGSMVLSLSMVDATVGYAALDNTVLQESSIAKYTA